MENSDAVPAAPPGVPDPGSNEVDAAGSLTGPELARNIADFHRKQLRQRRFADLTCEKYLLHIDGEGFSQFLDLYDGQRLALPVNAAGLPRMQENLLRPCVDHMVAYHTAQNFQFVTETKDDRKDRERALIDQIWCNHLATKQRLNTVIAAAMYMACGAGHTPVHAYWRNDSATDVYEPIKSGGDVSPLQAPVRGMIDFWVGDPFATVYHPGSKRTSVPMYQYERVMPAEMVRQAFSQTPGIENLQGSDKLPSVSRYVRTVRNWMLNSAYVHGFGGMITGENSEELISLLFQEIAPGVDPRVPDGRLRIVAMRGSAEVSQEGGELRGSPLLLHDGPLPGGVLSSVRLYSHPGGRQDDVKGKPYVADIDDMQTELNQALSERKYYILRATRAPLVTEEELDDDAIWDTDAMVTVEPNTQIKPYFLEPPSRHIPALNQHIQELREAIWTQSGYQAASRGEGHAGDAAAKVRMLSQLDDEQHGPTNTRMREDVEDLMGIAWALMKEFGDVPWVIDNIGAEHAHIIGRYVDRSMLSETPPTFRIVSGIGATPDAQIQQMLDLVSKKGADGEPLMRTAEFRANFPDKRLFPEAEDPLAIRQRRPKVINAEIRRQTEAMLEAMAQRQVPPEIIETFAPAIEAAVHESFPVLPDDILPLHIQELGNITQDEQENRIVRRVAGARQARYRTLIQQMQAGAQPASEPQEDRQAERAQAAERQPRRERQEQGARP